MSAPDPRVVCDHSEDHEGPRRVWLRGDDGARLFEVEFLGDDRALAAAVHRVLINARAAGFPVEILA